MTNQEFDTDFYRTAGGFPAQQSQFFRAIYNRCTNHRDKIVCLNSGEPRNDQDRIHKLYHLDGTTVFVNDYDPSQDRPTQTAVTITGRLKDRIAARKLLESIASIGLIQRDPLNQMRDL